MDNSKYIKSYASEESIEEYVKKNIAQPDWNQSDSTAPDYIKNRPFYKHDVVEEETSLWYNGDFSDFLNHSYPGNGITYALYVEEDDEFIYTVFNCDEDDSDYVSMSFSSEIYPDFSLKLYFTPEGNEVELVRGDVFNSAETFKIYEIRNVTYQIPIKLNKMYLPNGVPVVSSPSVGQIAVVKSVNGDSIEWEPIDRVVQYDDLENKPFYTEMVTVGRVLIVENAFEYEHGNSIRYYDDIYYEEDDDGEEYEYRDVEYCYFDQSLKEGSHYLIHIFNDYNSNSYEVECVAQRDKNGDIGLGNTDWLDDSNGNKIYDNTEGYDEPVKIDGFYLVNREDDKIYLYACDEFFDKFIDGDYTHIYIDEVIYNTHKLSSEYIPDNIPLIESAVVGQIIRVKAVDENGKPTEWETVDLPKADAIPDAAGDTPTAEEFNNLLAVLRNAGLLSEI